MTQPNENLDDWKRYNVAQGVLLHGEQVLLVGNDYGYKNLVWSLPGGRLEPGEQHPTALVREFKEETGLDIIPGDFIYVMDARSVQDKRHFVTCVFSARLADEANPETLITCAADAAVKQVRFVSFPEAAQSLLRPSLGEPLINYLYYRDRMPRRYWRYSEYQRRDWKPISWPPSPDIQAE